MDTLTTKFQQVLLAASAFALLIMGGCYYDNEECLYPEGTTACDTMNVAYSTHILPIITDNCLICHSGGTPSGNVSLDGYDNVRNAALIPAGSYGSLIGVISHAPGNSPMPRNADKLSDCKIRQVEIWIGQGTPEN